MAARTSSDLEVFFVAAWVIWYNRNHMVFEFTCQLLQQIWNFVMGYLKGVQGNSRSQPLHRTVECRKWEAPPCRAFQINVDGATSEQGRNSGVGVVINAAWSKYLVGLFSVMEVELLAIESSILLAKELKIPNIEGNFTKIPTCEKQKKIEKTHAKESNHTHKTIFTWFGNLPTSTELQRFHYY